MLHSIEQIKSREPRRMYRDSLLFSIVSDKRR
nr:MAG TPA: hypothetical protein [Caudoviricetes sp.]